MFKEPNKRNILSKIYPHFSEESNRKVSPKSQYTIPQYPTHRDSYSEHSFPDFGQDCGLIVFIVYKQIRLDNS